MTDLELLHERKQELEQVIDLESEFHNEWSNQLVQNAQMEIDLIKETIEQLATSNCIVL